MLYIKKAVTNTIKVALGDKLTSSVTEYKVILTNDIRQVNQELVISPTFTNRYAQFDLTEPTDLALVDEGSYTYEFKADNVSIAKGKAIVFDGTFSTESKFGDEVKYKEHTNTTTNTQYITI
tara:strand:+ start:21046 stop:21411 length:366 start_codon:yes stop_codon:yes gene_type:complete